MLAALPRPANAADTLEQVRTAGTLNCGDNTEETDYSKFEAHGDLSILRRDVCQAVAAVVLRNADKVESVGFLDDTHSLAAISSGKVVLLAGGTPDLANDAAFGVGFGPPVFLDG